MYKGDYRVHFLILSTFYLKIILILEKSCNNKNGTENTHMIADFLNKLPHLLYHMSCVQWSGNLSIDRLFTYLYMYIYIWRVDVYLDIEKERGHFFRAI